MRTRTIWLAATFLIGAGALALLLDLRFQGLVWRFLYYQTGEEGVMSQLRGAVELPGNLIRPPLRTAPFHPIQHASEIPYGMNVFLQKEVEEDKIRAMLTMIREAGFVWLRQEFPWEDLEVDGRGQFTDSRNDLTGDGLPDTIDAWLKYDRIVDLVEEYGMRLMVRLSNPPAWAHANNPNIGTFAPPDDFDDFVNYAVAVAQRYKGRIHHYQVWNEPNIYPEWGEQFADPAAYTDLLCRTYRALKAVDPEIVVISAAIAPTISLDGFMGYQDVAYLQAMYNAGAAACFDVLAAQGYGLFSGAYDRRQRVTTVTAARHVFYRDLMVANGDAHKPIWISEAAWNAVLDAPLPPEQIIQYDRFGLSTQEQAARYTPELYQRAQQEWPWVGVVFYWFFTRPDPSEMTQSFYYFRMAEPDYSPEKPTFTPLPVYDSMRAFITQQRPTLYAGQHQAEAWPAQHDGQIVPLGGAQLGAALRAQRYEVTAHGSRVRVRLHAWPAGAALHVNGAAVDVPAAAGWQTITVADGMFPQAHQIVIESAAPVTIDALTVEDRLWHLLGVPLLLLVAGAGGIIGLLTAAVRERRQPRRPL
ncbi:MAG: hypothetical protein SNJ83_00195 [Aggregatilineales bacterium]